jgi:hypothetical protein
MAQAISIYHPLTITRVVAYMELDAVSAGPSDVLLLFRDEAGVLATRQLQRKAADNLKQILEAGPSPARQKSRFRGALLRPSLSQLHAIASPQPISPRDNAQRTCNARWSCYRSSESQIRMHEGQSTKGARHFAEAPEAKV